jgi:hypothetical protein
LEPEAECLFMDGFIFLQNHQIQGFLFLKFIFQQHLTVNKGMRAANQEPHNF